MVAEDEELVEALDVARIGDAVHIQLDGRGDDFYPGSGNAPPGANTLHAMSDAEVRELVFTTPITLLATLLAMPATR